jgi:hypothetical protein
MAALLLMAACQTVATNDAELAASKKEFLLAQSGFKVITVTTTKQQQAINGLAQYRVSAVKYQGKLYYVFPTAKKDKIYVGRQKQFNAYKKALAAQQGSQPASQQAQPGQQLINPAPTFTYEGAGPSTSKLNSSMVLARWARRLWGIGKAWPAGPICWVCDSNC